MPNVFSEYSFTVKQKKKKKQIMLLYWVQKKLYLMLDFKQEHYAYVNEFISFLANMLQVHSIMP